MHFKLNLKSGATVFVPAFTGNFFVHITKVTQPQISYITVSVSHGICDGEGMVNVLLRKDSIPEPPMDFAYIRVSVSN